MVTIATKKELRESFIFCDDPGTSKEQKKQQGSL